MNPKSTGAVFFASIAAIAALATHAMAGIIPPIGLAPGSEYQLIFVTADTTTATSTNISDYNTFVTNEAALNPSLPSATWDAVGSTATVNANVNAQNVMVDGSYLPVYNTQGIEVSGIAGLYSGSLLNVVDYNQNGVLQSSVEVWTGSTTAGVGDGAFVLGNTPEEGTEFGDSQLKTAAWIEFLRQNSTAAHTLYALSTPLTVPTPEPATITLLGSALSLLAGFYLLRRRRGTSAMRAVASH